MRGKSACAPVSQGAIEKHKGSEIDMGKKATGQGNGSSLLLTLDRNE